MRGRVSIPDFITGDFKKDIKKVNKYIKVFKKILDNF